MKKKKSIIQSKIVLLCLVFIFCAFLQSVVGEVKDLLFHIQMEENHFIGWDIENTRVTTASLLALGGIMDAKSAGVLGCVIELIHQLSILLMTGLLLVFAIRNHKEIRPFTLQTYQYLKFGILLAIFIPVLVTVSKIVLLIVIMPPLDWMAIIHTEVSNVMEILFEIVVYLCLLYSWHDGIHLQSAFDETI